MFELQDEITEAPTGPKTGQIFCFSSENLCTLYTPDQLQVKVSWNLGEALRLLKSQVISTVKYELTEKVRG